jgi:hypothetical protein
VLRLDRRAGPRARGEFLEAVHPASAPQRLVPTQRRQRGPVGGGRPDAVRRPRRGGRREGRRAVDGRLCAAVGSGGAGRPASRDRRRPAGAGDVRRAHQTNRFALISRVNAVKRAETRTRKIAECVAMLARHETIHRSEPGRRTRQRRDGVSAGTDNPPRLAHPATPTSDFLRSWRGHSGPPLPLPGRVTMPALVAQSAAEASRSSTPSPPIAVGRLAGGRG